MRHQKRVNPCVIVEYYGVVLGRDDTYDEMYQNQLEVIEIDQITKFIW